MNLRTLHLRFMMAVFLVTVASHACQAQTPAPTPPSSCPETVIATFRVKPAQIDAFLALMPDYWAALRLHNMVLAEPHVLMRGTENDMPTVVEVFTWRTHDIADNVPPDIQAFWDKFSTMVEARDGHKPIEFPEMTIIPLPKH